MALRVHVLCRNVGEDRILPRMARLLRDHLGWTAGVEPPPHADVIYLLGYFEAQMLRPWPRPTGVGSRVMAYFTHREEEPANNAKARLFDDVAGRVALRVVMCRLYGDMIRGRGPTVQIPLPVERERFTIARSQHNRTVTVGLAGFTYSNHRKGEDLVMGMVNSPIGRRVTWHASGRGWPVPTRAYSWAEMPQFYQGLDVLVVPSRVEGGPMTTLEALACGVRVVIPRHVGLHDEIPQVAGIYRYERGNLADLLRALEQAVNPRETVDRAALREAVAGHSVQAWCQGHAEALKLLQG